MLDAGFCNEDVKLKKNAALGWLGGKHNMKKYIVSLFPKDFKCYVEPFCGAAWVLFEKEPGGYEIINDINEDLINFYKVVKEKPVEFLYSFRYELIARKTFELYKSELKNPELELSDVERAKRFFYVMKTSFAGMGSTFGNSTTSHPKLNLTELDRIVFNTHERLKKVTIENRDWRDMLTRLDREHVFYFFDPPYRCATSKKYAQHLTDDDYKEMAQILRKLKGKFILTINDDPFIRETFKDFNVQEVDTTYSVEKAKSKKVTELLYKNY